MSYKRRSPIPVVEGGTGSQSLTGVLLGNGTSAITGIGAATNGQLIIGSTGVNPVLSNLTSTGDTLIITNGPGSINLETGDAVPTSFPTDDGTANPISGALNIFGNHGINTTGVTDTVGVAINNTITLGDIADETGSDALTISTGDISVVSGNINIPLLGNSGLSGVIKVDGQPAIFATDVTNWFSGVGVANFNPGVLRCTYVGGSAGSVSITAVDSVALGYNALANPQSPSDCIAIGVSALSSADSPDRCIAIGSGSLTSNLFGENNIAIGHAAGNNYNGAESDNILINNFGVLGDNATIRIGTDGTHTSFYAAGIDGVDVGSVATVVTQESNQLGTAVLTAGANVVITPGANTITIAATGSLTSIDLTGDSGPTLTGDAFIISGGTTGLELAGTTGPDTLTLEGTLVVSNGGSGANSLTGILTGNGTSAFTASTVTEDAILIGGAGNSVTDLGVAGDGEILIGSSGTTPVLTTITSTGGSIEITNGAGSINLETGTGGGFIWVEVTGSSETMQSGVGYVANRNTLITFTLPTAASLGDTIKILGKGVGLWRIVYGANQQINFSSATTTITTGSLSSTNARDSIELICSTASNTEPIYTVASSIGNITVV